MEDDPFAVLRAETLNASMVDVIQRQVDTAIKEMVAAYRTAGITMDELSKVLIGNVAIIHGAMKLEVHLQHEAIMAIDEAERKVQ